MKKTSLICGIIIGLLLLGSVFAATNEIFVKPSTQDIYVNGEKVEMTAYNINDNNYVRLRDIGKAVDCSVEYDEITDSVHIDRNYPYSEEKRPVIPELEALEDVYFQIFCDLFDPSESLQYALPGYSRYLSYMSLDLTNVKFMRKNLIVEKFEKYCEENELTLLLYTQTELNQNGYLYHGISAGSKFAGGVQIEFYDQELSDGLLVTDIYIIYDFGDRSRTASYKAEKINDKWILTVN